MPHLNRGLPVPVDHDLAASLVIATGMLARRRGRWSQVDEHSGGMAVVPAYLDQLDAAGGESVLGPDGRVVDMRPIA